MLDKLEINNNCVPCDSCSRICPEKAIYSNGQDYAIDISSCILCGLCIEVCPVDAIRFQIPKKN